MNLDEKKALQMVVMDEISQRQQSDPTLLIDVLLAGDGPGFVRQLLTARTIVSRNLVAMNEHLLRAIDLPPTLPLREAEPAWNGNGAAEEA